MDGVQELDGAEEGTQLEVTSLHWISSRALLVGCHLVLGDAKQAGLPSLIASLCETVQSSDVPPHWSLQV